MSKRLQVLVAEAEMDEIRRIARRHGLTVGEWVRKALLAARKQEPAADPATKLKALRKVVQYSFPPAVDIQDMLAEIERGYQD